VRASGTGGGGGGDDGSDGLHTRMPPGEVAATPPPATEPEPAPPAETRKAV
jgi:hypothetical protein